MRPSPTDEAGAFDRPVVCTTVSGLPHHLHVTTERALRAASVRGAAIAVFDRDGLRAAGGVGTADESRREPVQPTTVFRVASISKLVTATLVLRLAEQGRLDLDAPVNDALPAQLCLLGPDGSPGDASLRAVLSHSSGLPGGIRGAELANPVLSHLANQGRVRDLEHSIAGLRFVRPSGDAVVYSNPGYNVAGIAAAHAAGEAFERAAATHVLSPLEMVDSGFVPERSGPGVATPYGGVLPPRPGTRPASGPRLVATPMGGLTSNVVDLSRFGRMVLRGGTVDGVRLLDEATVADATSLEATNHPRLEQGYGLGFRVRQWRGRTVVGHDGNMPGVATQLVLSPDDGVGVVVLTNGFPLSVPHRLAETVLADVLDLGEVVPAPAPAEGELVAWQELARRAEGTFRLLDAAPPGVIGRANDAMTRVRVLAGTDGSLQVVGNPGSHGDAVLRPDGEPGRYRVDAPVDNGTDAVLESRRDGLHLWMGPVTHLHRRTPTT